jgi:hypothetical protein
LGTEGAGAALSQEFTPADGLHRPPHEGLRLCGVRGNSQRRRAKYLDQPRGRIRGVPAAEASSRCPTCRAATQARRLSSYLRRGVRDPAEHAEPVPSGLGRSRNGPRLSSYRRLHTRPARDPAWFASNGLSLARPTAGPTGCITQLVAQSIGRLILRDPTPWAVLRLLLHTAMTSADLGCNRLTERSISRYETHLGLCDRLDHPWPPSAEDARFCDEVRRDDTAHADRARQRGRPAPHASQSLQALALAPTAPHAAWQTCPLRPAPLAGRRLIGWRRLCQDADSYETGGAGSLSTGPTVSAW